MSTLTPDASRSGPTLPTGRDVALEAALRGVPGVLDAFAPHVPALLAYVVPSNQEAPRIAALLGLLGGRVDGARPVPRRIVFVDAFPLRADGQPDADCLPMLDAARDECGGLQAVPTCDEIERHVAQAWEDVIGEPVGRFDDMRHADGFSLMATQVASRLSQSLGRAVPVRRVHEALAVWHLAAALRTPVASPADPASPSGEARTTISRPDSAHAAMSPAHDADAFALSPFQQRIWTADRLALQAAAYHISLGWRVSGALDVVALCEAVLELQRRHDALRLRIDDASGQPMQRVVAADDDAQLHVVEVHTIDAVGVAAAIAAEARAPFALDREGPMRTRLLRLSEQDHLLLLTVHHVAADGGSIGLMVRELAALYAAAIAGAPVPLAPQPLSLRQVAAQEQRRVDDSASSAAFWSSRLASSAPALALPFDRAPAAEPAHAGDSVNFEFPASLADGVRAFATRHRTTTFAVFATALLAFLSRLGAGRELRLGYPVARRDGLERERTVGCLINTLSLAASVEPEASFEELLQRVQDELLAATAHPDALLERLPGRRAGASHDEVLLNLNEHDRPALALAGLAVCPLERRCAGAPYALAWILSPRGASFSGRLEYDRERFDRATAERLSGLWCALLASALEAPERPLDGLEWLSVDERTALLALGDGGPAAHAGTPLAHRAVAHWARITPHALAVRCAERSLSYAELDAANTGLAQRLRALGVGPGDLVAVRVSRGIALPVALLAVHQVGAAYLPLDSQAPEARLAALLRDARPRVVLVDDANASGSSGSTGRPAPGDGRAPERLVVDPDARAMPSTPVPPFDDAPTGAPAYCLYTSGSTGAPKGVLVSYGALAAHVQAVADAFAVTARDRVLQFSAFSFDTSIEQFMVAWSAGAGVVMREDAPWSADELFDRVREQAVTIADIPVSYWHLLAARFEREAVDAPLRMLVVGGEAVVAGPHGAPGQTLPRALNAYGPTETTITCTLGDLHDVRGRSGPYVPIGRPLPGTRVFVLDDRLRPVPRGVAGEVFVAGSRVALGYLRRPGLTAERFLPCPFGAPGERMYRSGDLGRWLPDGRLEFLGRRDFQVKLGGVRIELGEIEQVLLRHQGVRDAAAMLAGSSDAPFLAACVVLRDGSGDLREVRAFAAEELAEAMRPARWLVLPALPLTAQGKVDRAALARDVAESATRSAAAPPSAAAPSPTLSRLLELLARLAPAPVCDPDMPLVDAGLHSLLMLRLVAQCGDVFGVALKPRELLKAGSARRIAALIDRLLPGGSSA